MTRQVPEAAAVAAKIEEILADLATLGDPDVGRRAEELVRTIVEFYGAGLERLFDVLAEATGADVERVVRELAADDLVGSLLVLHDLHPDSTMDRVSAALEKVRPYLGSHSGDVELLGVDDDGTVRLRLAGSCNGCPSSTVTVKLAIEQAIHDAAPEIVRVDVEGVVAEPAAGTGPGGRPLLPISASTAPPPPPPRWLDADGLDGIGPGSVRAANVGGARTVVCNVDGQLYAYRDRCPACSAALAGGTLTGRLLACPACGERYDIVLAGRDAEHDRLHLDPLPLLSGNGGVRIAVPS
ncbi:NifU family protein [Actinokineospora sp.]|uniref:NifU family protein n=1 Tax=Actinokineospora sp. TaxID=1872133 RepID=UPI0040384079